MGVLICEYTHATSLLWALGVTVFLTINSFIFEIINIITVPMIITIYMYTKRCAVVVQVPATCFLLTYMVSSEATYILSENVHFLILKP